MNPRGTAAVRSLWVLLALSAVARFTALGAKSFWYDELHTLGYTRSVLDGWSNLKFILTSGRPLYFVLSAPFLPLFDDPAWAIRIVAAAAGVAGVGLLWLAGTRLTGAAPATFAAALTVLHSFHFFLSREARYYSLFFALVAAAVAAHAHLWQAPSPRRVVVLALVLALGMHTHLLFAAVVGALAVLDAFRVFSAGIGRREVVRTVASLYGLVLLFNVPLNRFGAVNVVRALLGVGGAETDVTVSSGFSGAPMSHFEHAWTASSPALLWRTVQLFVGEHPAALIGGAGLLVLGVLTARRTAPSLLAYAGALALATWLPLVVTRPTHPVVPRYLLACLPPILLLQGVGAASAWKPGGAEGRGPRLRRTLAAGFLLLVGLGQGLSLADYVRGDHQGWRDAVRALESRIGPQESVWLYREWQEAIFRYYARRTDLAIHCLPPLQGEAGLAEIGRRLREAASAGRIWVFNVSYRPPPGWEEFLVEEASYPGLGDLDTLHVYRSRGP